MNILCLVDKTCVPCRGDTPSLDHQEVEKLLAELGHDWKINGQGHLQKKYTCKGFMGAMDFANKVAVIAEQEAHHPDLIIAWGRCEVEVWTHKIKGLSENDFILAAKIEAEFNKN